jgi:hypothetical protein
MYKETGKTAFVLMLTAEVVFSVFVSVLGMKLMKVLSIVCIEAVAAIAEI